MMRENRKEVLSNLELVRVFSMILILIVHIGMTMPTSEDFNRHYIYVGAKGVQLFFVLSGFLAAYSYKGKGYYLRKIVRILPGYYTVLVGWWIWNFITKWDAFSLRLAFHLGTDSLSLEELLGINGICGIKYLTYFVFGQSFIPSNDYWKFNNWGAMWTMSSFAFFYLIYPLIHKFINGFWKSMICSLILLYSAPYMKNWIYGFYDFIGGGVGQRLRYV